MRHILVTGGTGTLGSHVVPQLRDAGCDVRVLSRHSRAAAEGIEYVASDLTTGEGIEPLWRGSRLSSTWRAARRVTMRRP